MRVSVRVGRRSFVSVGPATAGVAGFLWLCVVLPVLFAIWVIRTSVVFFFMVAKAVVQEVREYAERSAE